MSGSKKWLNWINWRCISFVKIQPRRWGVFFATIKDPKTLNPKP